MRTTVELADNQRAALLAIAAQRGLRGFSAVIAEALDVYLRLMAEKDPVVKAALALRGSWSAQEAVDAEASLEALRAGWRDEPRHA